MTLDTEAAARSELARIIKELETLGYRLLGVRTSLPPVDEEDADQEDLNEDPDAPMEMRAIIGCVLKDCLYPAINDLRSAARYRPRRLSLTGRKLRAQRPRTQEAKPEAMPEEPPMSLDLSTFSEATRRALYDRLLHDELGPLDPFNSPDDLELNVSYAFGRWFASWLKPEQPGDAPESARRALYLLSETPEAPGKLFYTEI
jgi:hypothetical protein